MKRPARNSIMNSSRSVKIEILKGDITEVECDAIVNPANSMMIMGGGVAAAIKRKGGKIIEEEAVRKAPVPVGEAIATIAGRLRAKYIIHAPTMEKPAMRTTPEKVEKAIKAAFTLAIKLGVKSIAFPGMGTGVGGLSPREFARIFKRVFEEMKNELVGSSLERVLLVAYTEDLYDALCKEIH